MITQFEYSQEADVYEMHGIIASMMDVLFALDDGAIPDQDIYPVSVLHHYLESLVNGQRKEEGQELTLLGSWAVVPTADFLPSDARVDFIFRPTYIATATLARAYCDHSEIASAIPGYLHALTAGMRFCSHRNLQGHGYEADEGAIDALQMLSMGKVPWLLQRHPDFCPELKRVIDVVADDMANRLASGSAHGAWGEDYSDGFRSALETMYLKSKPGLVDSILNARSDSESFSEDSLPW
jgi:hypothetical protein